MTSRTLRDTTRRTGGALIALLFVATLAQPAIAQESAPTSVGSVLVWGRIGLQVQGSSVDGSNLRFRKDVGADEGLSLFDSRITITPAEDGGPEWFDRVAIVARGLGEADKYRWWSVRADKNDRYRLRVRQQTVDAFWNVTGEIHAWDLRRSNTHAEFAVDVSDELEVFGNFRGFRQTRSRTTTRDIQRQEFAFEEPLDQRGLTFGFGGRWRTGSTRLYLEQTFHDFEDNGGFGSRGFDDGFEAGGTFLTFFEQRELRDASAPTTRVGLVTRLADDRLTLRGDLLYSDQSLDFDFDRAYEGADFRDIPIAVQDLADGKVEREVFHGDLRADWRTGDRVTVYGQYRRRSWDQRGTRAGLETVERTETGSVELTPSDDLSTYDVAVDQLRGGLEVRASDAVTLHGEVGVSMRDQTFRVVGTEGPFDEDSTTEATTFEVGGRARLGSRADASLRYARGDVDDPFSRVAPTDVDSVRARLRWRPAAGWEVVGSYTGRDTANELTDAEFDVDSIGLAASYRFAPRRWLRAGYSRLEYKSSVPIRFVAFFFGNFRDGVAIYEGDDDVWTFAGEYALADAPITLRAQATRVDSAGTFPVRTRDLAVGAELTLANGLLLEGSFRWVGYDDDSELPSTVDDFTARVFSLGLGYRF